MGERYQGNGQVLEAKEADCCDEDADEEKRKGMRCDEMMDYPQVTQRVSGNTQSAKQRQPKHPNSEHATLRGLSHHPLRN